MAQEEELFRRTTLSLSLPRDIYPLHGMATVMSPHVTVFRTVFCYQIVDPRHWFDISVLTAAAIRKPRVENNTYARARDRRLMRRKIERVLELAPDGCALVLGAWGCGAFGHPPEEVAMLFRGALQRHAARFRVVRFAVLSTHDRNFEVFARVLKG